MKKEEHTDGPWVVEDLHIMSKRKKSDEWGELCIASVGDTDWLDDKGKPLPDSEVIANAHLIAAAPRLKKALRHALDRLNSIPHSYRDTNFKLIESALAESEGKKRGEG